MSADYLKHNEAIRFGWVILYIMSHDLAERKVGKTIHYILSIINDRPEAIQKKLSPRPVKSTYEETINKLLEDH